ncbi:MAG: TatD family hydrolase [Spirochaetales bacterium]|nr:TatD family hydrolase [Spirochaetales bacterium]
MLTDFHSHIASEFSIVCTDTPDAPVAEKALMNCIGLLPDKWTEELENLLYKRLSEDKTIHMGEVGLDRRFQDKIPMEKQLQILKREMLFTIENNKSITLHCVRATGLMTELLSQLKFRPFSVLWHGFTGSAETAKQLYHLGVIVSLGPRMSTDAEKIRKIFSANPMTVLETDLSKHIGGIEMSVLAEHYQRTEDALGGIRFFDNISEALKIFTNKA